MIVRSRSPLRIGLGGGGTDVPPYCWEHGGVTLSVAINYYTITTWDLSKGELLLESADLGLETKIENLGTYSGKYDLIEATLKLAEVNEIQHKGKISIHCDVPTGTGLGTSSSAVVSLLGAIWDVTGKSYEEALNSPMTKYKIADLACKIEREELAIHGGYQDQYASAFGGINWIKYSTSKDVEVVPLRVSNSVKNEFESRLLLIHTGETRLGGNIIKNQKEQYKKGQNLDNLDGLKNMAYDMRKSLTKGDIDELGSLLHNSWMLKRNVAKGTTTKEIDKLYSIARNEGALGGKISGAGGGGVMFFIVDEPINKQKLFNKLKKQKPEIQNFNFSFESKGIYTWRK